MIRHTTVLLALAALALAGCKDAKKAETFAKCSGAYRAAAEYYKFAPAKGAAAEENKKQVEALMARAKQADAKATEQSDAKTASEKMKFYVNQYVVRMNKDENLDALTPTLDSCNTLLKK